MSKNNNIQFSILDYILIATIAFILISSWIYVIINYNNLPNIIATHFDELGKPNGYGNKNNIWVVIIIFSLLSIGAILESKHQRFINILKRNTSLSEEESNLKIMLYTAILLASISSLIIYSMIQASLVKNFEMPLIVPIIISLVIFYLIAVFYQKFKNKNHD